MYFNYSQHKQKGFSVIPILIGILLIVLIGGGGYYFYNQQKLTSIKNFDDCAKHFPVMASYPGQCNTPDGRHFVQELSDEEKKKLIPPNTEEPTNISQYCKNYSEKESAQAIKDCGDFVVLVGPCCDQQDIILDKNGKEIAKCGGIAGYIGDCKKYLPQTQCSEVQCSAGDETSNWELYTNNKLGYSIEYPKDKYVICRKEDFYLYEGDQDSCNAGERPTDFLIIPVDELRKTESQENDCYSIKKEPVTVSGAKGYKYTSKAKSLEGECNNMENHYRGAFEDIEVSYKGVNYQISYFNKTDLGTKHKILSTFKFTN